MYTATNVSRSVRPKEGKRSPEGDTSLKLGTAVKMRYRLSAYSLARQSKATKVDMRRTAVSPQPVVVPSLAAKYIVARAKISRQYNMISDP